MPKRFNNTLGDEELDRLFCSIGKKYKFKAKFLKAMALCESSLDEHAYRHEENYWGRKKEEITKKFPEIVNNPAIIEGDDTEISASYGLMQLMFTTAWALIATKENPCPQIRGEDLYNPVYNIELGAQYMRILVDKCKKERWHFDTPFNPMSMALARYNGGSYGVPDHEGWIREQPLNHMRKVFKAFQQLMEEEEECE